jgi:two-component system, cell cycle response regulator
MARVLVLEDNMVNLDLMRYLLDAHGHEVLAGTNGVEGLELMRAERPDIVVCDIEMPVLDGIGFVQAVRAEPAFAAVPLLAVTSNAMVGDRARFIAGGFDDYCSKPIDPTRFVPWMESHLGRVANAAPQPAPAPAPAAPVLEPHGPLVLVVDDQPLNLNLKKSALEPLGYRVALAGSAAEAVELALAEPPALIISDVGMPEGDGFEFIYRVKNQPALRGVPFIFLTATHWDPHARAKAMALGAWRYLRRPLPMDVLLAEVERAIKSR